MSRTRYPYDQFYFVYGDYTTETPPRPFYFGKGKLSRVRALVRNSHHTLIAKTYGCQRRVLIVTTEEHIAFHYECYFIKTHKTNRNRCDEGHWGANLTDGGQGLAGKPKSIEWRRKQSLKQRGRPKTPEARAKMSAAQKGKHISKEHHEKMMAPLRAKGMKRSPEAIAKGWETRRRNAREKNVATDV